MVKVEELQGGGDRREEKIGGGGGGGIMVASQLVLVNHFFLALVHNTPDPATVPEFNSVVVNAGCDRGCRLCSPVNGCLACEPPFFMVLQRDGARQTASCTKTCPRGFFKVKKKRNGFCSKCTMLGCEECLRPHYCSTCQQHYFNYFGRCIQEATGKNKTENLGITTEHTLMTELKRKDGNKEETKTEEEKEKEDEEEEGIQIMVTSPHTPTTTTSTTVPNTTQPSPTITPTPRSSPSPLPPVPTPTTSPPSPSSERDKGHLRPCRRRRRRRRKHKHGRKATEKINRRKNRNKERRKDVINRRRQCRRGGRGGRRGRRKGRRWGGRRREKKRKTSNTTTINNVTTTTTTTTIINITTETPTTTQMIDLSLLGEEGRVGNSHLAGSTNQMESHKFFYNNRPREMARFKQSKAYRQRKPAYVRGKRVRHAKTG